MATDSNGWNITGLTNLLLPAVNSNQQEFSFCSDTLTTLHGHDGKQVKLTGAHATAAATHDAEAAAADRSSTGAGSSAGSSVGTSTGVVVAGALTEYKWRLVMS
eukprot:SAG22_NODE_897_length_6629_cov_4.853446_9_plen_104_part_00